MAHYQPNVCQVPATRCWGKKISLGGAFSLSLAGASAEYDWYQCASVTLRMMNHASQIARYIIILSPTLLNRKFAKNKHDLHQYQSYSGS